MDIAKVGITFYLQIFATDGSGNGKSGLIINYKIIKAKGGTVFTSGIMTEDTNNPGVYVKAITFASEGYYRVIYDAPEGYIDSMETIEVTI